MVSVLHKELEYKVEKLKYKKLKVMQSRIKNKWWIDHLGIVHTKFYSRDWLIQSRAWSRAIRSLDTVYHLLVKNNKGEGRGGEGAYNFLPLKRGAQWLEGGGLFERGTWRIYGMLRVRTSKSGPLSGPLNYKQLGCQSKVTFPKYLRCSRVLWFIACFRRPDSGAVV